VIIDGTTQPGYTNAPLITLDGVTKSFVCLLLANTGKTGSSVIALDITNCHSLSIQGSGGHNSVTLSTFHGNIDGVAIRDSPGNVIGDPGNPSNGNLITDNGKGIRVEGKKARGNTIVGNHIGVDAAGNAAVPNDDGLSVSGPSTVVRENVISGNTISGVGFGPAAKGSLLFANRIGTNAAGTAALANGVGAYVQAANVQVVQNVISGNIDSGLNIAGSHDLVTFNLIGTNAAGNAALANGRGLAVFALPKLPSGGHLVDTNLISGNTGDGVYINGSARNVFIRNFIGTNSDAGAAVANGANGIEVTGEAGAQQIGGAIGSSSNVISGNGADGILISVPGVKVQGNLVGTNQTGVAAIGNGSAGVAVDNGGFALIGGSKTQYANLISGNTLAGVAITGGTGTKVRANFIGFGVDGQTNLGNTAYGIGVSSSGNMIGPGNYIGWSAAGLYLVGDGNTVRSNFIGLGTQAAAAPNATGVVIDGDDNIVGGQKKGQGNAIFDNTNAGITVTANGTANSLLGNLMLLNGGLGIDLAAPGVNPNDADDPDTGANNEQNYPVITSATVTNGKVTFSGTLNSTPSSNFMIEFFANGACDASGYGEGAARVATAKVKTDVNGDASFTITAKEVFPGSHYTATATNLATGDTSEFSLCV
jgi:hypothetical protein